MIQIWMGPAKGQGQLCLLAAPPWDLTYCLATLGSSMEFPAEGCKWAGAEQGLQTGGWPRVHP